MIYLRRFYAGLFCLLTCTTCGKNNTGNGGSTPAPAPVPTPSPTATGATVAVWRTAGNSSELLSSSSLPVMVNVAAAATEIAVDTTQTYQTVDGFGYTLTGGSAYVINRLGASEKAALLQELFGNTGSSISISYLRLSIGASDMNASVFSYDDVPSGQTDVTLAGFSLAPDKTELMPLLKEITAINPAIKIVAAPWSAPVWMKDNNSFKGGILKPEYYAVYAQYFVKYIQQMKAEGITIDAVTPQNEPLNPDNNPSLYMTAAQQTDFIKSNLGPAFQTAGLTTKIIAYDHNCDKPEYPLAVLGDAAARNFVNGSAFHLYSGDISALSQVHYAYPDKQVYFTEQYTASTGDFGGDLKWHLKNVVIGAMRNWSRNALEWNLANDPSYGPHTTGGCNTCKGALTISGTSGITRNVGYYIIAHASKAVSPGSVRLGTTVAGSLQNVAFKTSAGKKVLITENDGTVAVSFVVRCGSNAFTASLAGGSVATYVW